MGEFDGPDFVHIVNTAYAESVHWRRSIFAVPSSKGGKNFVLELSRLICAYADLCALESIALKAAMLMPQLLLQKPHPGSKACDHASSLDHRLTVWKKGDIDRLMREAHTI